MDTNLEPRRTKVILEGFDVLDTVRFISRMNKRYQAALLAEIEKLIDKNDPLYFAIRKLILDNSSEYTRTIVKNIFGDVDV